MLVPVSDQEGRGEVHSQFVPYPSIHEVIQRHSKMSPLRHEIN